MGEKAEYKSAIRSRKMIRHAFVELLMEKDCEKITVKNIVERADISRGTFYAHYSDIYAMIAEIENEVLGKMLEFLDEFKGVELILNPNPFLLKMAHFFEQDIEFYRMLIISTKGAPDFVMKMKAVLLENLIEKILDHKEAIHSTQEQKEFILRVNFFVGGLFSLYQEWFAGKIECSLKELTTTVSSIMMQGFQSFTLK
ncbi:TetR/AcrR family transcriptional regulator [Rummeliibacillus suwonensis]|uniref:TetR/AcrR family transcriptional regulator n=1 Tax=Rummeliibacillus suwonensis TaxID=1306154 RepID=UPI0011B54165|nr:TetR/AcrR family transcriptional regulator [Rummeliibacillus suwonensis]